MTRFFIIRHMICLVGFLLSTGLAQAQSTGLVRLGDRSGLLGWEAVGRLDLNGTGYCTATLIASDLVLTAAHCVYDKATGQLVDTQALLFRAGLRDGQAIAERSVLQVAAHQRYNPRAGMSFNNIRHDVALLRLADPITSTDADPFILHSGTVQDGTISVTSYGQGRSDALSRQRSCSIVGMQDGLIAFDCDVTFGSSGAPVFAKVGNRGRILSIVSGGSKADGKTLALGMSLPKVVAELKADLRRAPVQAPLAPIRRVTVGGGSTRAARNQTGAKFVKP